MRYRVLKSWLSVKFVIHLINMILFEHFEFLLQTILINYYKTNNDESNFSGTKTQYNSIRRLVIHSTLPFSSGHHQEQWCGVSLGRPQQENTQDLNLRASSERQDTLSRKQNQPSIDHADWNHQQHPRGDNQRVGEEAADSGDLVQ